MADLTAEQQAFLDGPDGEQRDATRSNGILISSKEVTKQSADSFSVFHGIDGSMSWFTRKGMAEVFTGDRDIWDGDDAEAMDEEVIDAKAQEQRDWADSRDAPEDGISKPPEIEDDGELKCPGCGWKYGHLYSMDANGPEDAICRDCMDDIGIDVDDAEEMKRYGIIEYAQETGDSLTQWLAVENVGYPGQTAFVAQDETPAEPRETPLMDYPLPPVTEDDGRARMRWLAYHLTDLLNSHLCEAQMHRFYELVQEKGLDGAYDAIRAETVKQNDGCVWCSQNQEEDA